MTVSPDQNTPVSVWSLRAGTLQAMFLILRAQWLIRRSPMSRWRGSLGELVDASPAQQDQAISEGKLRSAAGLARRVERAATRFPREPKCLPQAMALQWLLGAAGADSRLVIAMHRQLHSDHSDDSSQEHAFHAWVEWGDTVLIGQCDRSEYRIVLSFQRQPDGDA